MEKVSSESKAWAAACRPRLSKHNVWGKCSLALLLCMGQVRPAYLDILEVRSFRRTHTTTSKIVFPANSTSWAPVCFFFLKSKVSIHPLSRL